MERDWSLLMAGCQDLKFDSGAVILAYGDTSSDAPFRLFVSNLIFKEMSCENRIFFSVTKGCVHAMRTVPSIDSPVVVRVLKVLFIF